MPTRNVHFKFAYGPNVPASSGQVFIRPTVRVVADGQVNLPVPVALILDVNGEASADLEITGDLSPFAWRIDEAPGRLPGHRDFAVPAGEGTLEYADAPPADPAPDSPEWSPVALEAIAARDAAIASALEATVASGAAEDAKADAETAAAEAAAFGGTNDAIMAAIAANDASAFTAELSSAYDRVIGVPSGASAATINAAFAAAGPHETVRLNGTYTTTTPIIITSHLDASGATINYTGTGNAVQVGVGGSGNRIDYKDIILPRVYNLTKTVAGWAQVAGSVGIKVINANTCRIVVPYVRNFETNIEMRGEGAGCQYTTVVLGHVSNGKVGIRFTADGTGWVNQNTFLGGRIDMDSAEGSHAAGSRYVLMENTFNAVNGNTWYGTALEGNGAEYAVETHGQYNSWVSCRWEASMGAQVWWRAAATRNSIRDGYGAPVITTEAGALRNEVSQPGTRRDVTASSTGGAFNFQNDSSGAAPAWTVMDPGTPISANDPATKYVLAATALLLKGKRASDSFDRIQLDMNSSRIVFGDGTVAPTASIGFDSAALLKVTSASVYPASHNTQDLGINATRWRYIRAGTAIITATFTTALRPAAAIGAGSMIFDTTLGKPIWSNGTAWVDATGATV